MTSASSEFLGPRRAAALVGLVLLSAACAGGARPHRILQTAPGSELARTVELLRSVQPDARLEGEHGLVVRTAADSLEVRWITPDPRRGALRIRAGDRLLHEVRTPEGVAHGVAVARPSQRRVSLEYGAADGGGGGRHVTEVRLEGPVRSTGDVGAVDSLFVVGDVHGEHETLVRVLGNAGLIDARGRWSGGGAHLVVLGDVFDRGPDVTKALWFLYRLEDEARGAGGRVHVVLGNHETMVLTGDLRYVSAKEQTLATLHGIAYPRLFDVERTVLGRWLATKPGVVRVGEVLLAHGGVAPPYADRPVRELNDSLAAFMGEELFRRWSDTTYVPPLDSAAYARRLDFFFGERSVFWHRDYVRSDATGALLERTLDRHGARVHVVAHTPVPTIEPRYGGRLFPVNVEPAASELLLLERRAGELRAHRYREEGPPVPLDGDG